jgi:hypothetical protein
MIEITARVKEAPHDVVGVAADAAEGGGGEASLPFETDVAESGMAGGDTSGMCSFNRVRIGQRRAVPGGEQGS